jgi:hypothetical protein
VADRAPQLGAAHGNSGGGVKGGLDLDSALRNYERYLDYLLANDPDFAFEYAVMGNDYIRQAYPPLQLQEYAVIHGLHHHY